MPLIEYRIRVTGTSKTMGLPSYKVGVHNWGTGQELLPITNLPDDAKYACFQFEQQNVAAKVTLFGPDNYVHVIAPYLNKSQDFSFDFLECGENIDLPPRGRHDASEAATQEQVDTNRQRGEWTDLECMTVYVRVVDGEGKALKGYQAQLYFAGKPPLTEKKSTDAGSGAKFHIRDSEHHLSAYLYKGGQKPLKTRVLGKPNTDQVVTFVLPES